MSELEEIYKLQGERNIFRKYGRRHTKLKVWILVIVLTIMSVGIWFFAKSLLTYTLSFDTLGGSEVPSVELKFLDRMPSPKTVPRKLGYYHAGWAKNKEGTEPFSFGSQIWWNTTAYAVWEEGVAIKLCFADGEENEDLSLTELRNTYEDWLKPGSSDDLPLVYNRNMSSVHYGERLLWFEDPTCTGDPIFDKTYTLADSIVVYGKWFDTGDVIEGMERNNYVVSSDGTLNKYVGYCKNLIFPARVKYIRNINRANFSTGSSDQIHDMNSPNFSVFERVLGTLKSVYLNDGLLRIGDCAFKDCVSLRVVKSLGNSLLSVGEYAFENTLINDFVLSSKVTAIGANAFNGAHELSHIVIGNAVTEIGAGAFANSGLKTITLPKVISIGKLAFAGCNNLTEVHLGNDELVNVYGVEYPEISEGQCDNIFFGTAGSSPAVNNLTIYVPRDLLDDYQNSYPWYVYAQYIRGE